MRVRLGAYAPAPRYDRAGLYRRLALDPRIELTVLFSSSAGVTPADLGYGQPVSFDADALSDFTSVFLRKAARTEHDGSFTSLLDLDIVREIRQRQFDVLWLHGYYSATHLLAAATQLARRGHILIREEQTLLNARPPWRNAVKRPLLRMLFARSTGLFQGTENRKWFRHFGMPEERLFHAPLCVDNDFFRGEAKRLEPRRRELRRSFGIADDAGPVILNVARLVPKKQQLVLLEAFRTVRTSQRCALLLVGAGRSEVELRDFVHRHRLPEVVFAGFLNQSEVSKAYAAADIFVLTSGWYETWGLVVNEAMNFSLPVVVSDKVGSAADLVCHGENGFVFDHARPADLADYLARLVRDPTQRDVFGRRSLEIIEPWNYTTASMGVVAAIRCAVGDERWSQAEAQAESGYTDHSQPTHSRERRARA